MKTALYESHCQLGAKIVDFSGWEMPLQYKGIIQEHFAVRNHVGIFDVSHMGRLLVEGKDAEKFLDYLSTNKIAEKSDFTAIYTVWCFSNGTCVDDVIIYKQDATHFFVIVNASNRQKDLDHLKREAAQFDVRITDRYHEDGIISLQGPLSTALLSLLFEEVNDLKHMHFCISHYQGEDIILSRTGYTGELGYEIYAPVGVIRHLWDRLLNEGQSYKIEPIGLGARDTLRLEMGYALYGHEINEEIRANESVSEWTIKWKKESFLGKDALELLKENPSKRNEYGVILLDKGIAREGYAVYHGEQLIGKVTSGTYSPSLSQAIAIILVTGECHLGDILEIQIRNSRCKAEIVQLPFLKKV